jgi:hypothetical protein
VAFTLHRACGIWIVACGILYCCVVHVVRCMVHVAQVVSMERSLASLADAAE